LTGSPSAKATLATTQKQDTIASKRNIKHPPPSIPN
jgi:hypothetical protein